MQNGNAYIEGIDNHFWEPIREYWKDRDAVNKGLDNDWWKNVKAAYKQPEMSNDDGAALSVDLGRDQVAVHQWCRQSRSRQPRYLGPRAAAARSRRATLKFSCRCSTATEPIRRCTRRGSKYLREYQPPTLIVWGKRDEIFPAAGAEPYKRDLKNLEYHLIDTGHFALETHGQEIADLMRDFLNRQTDCETQRD